MQKAIFSNVLVFGLLGTAAVLYSVDASAFRAMGQEDGFLEWATFWAFILAGMTYFRVASVDRRNRGGLPWFAMGLAIFCLLVAMEEISWGQRVLGYQPPEYFLEQNYQQEFNLHNVLATDVRMLAMQLILVGYGVIASALGLIPAVARWYRRLHIVDPPPSLIPSFAALAVTYAWYPVDLTGEWVECGLGLAFVGSALLATHAGIGSLLASTAATALLAGTTVAVFAATHADPGKVAAVRDEIEALRRDFESPKVHTRCGIHKRLYTFMREYGQPYLVQGDFARLVMASEGPIRAGYLLDPWNSPYWLRHQCDGGRPVIFVYSFGPNRQRDSTEREIRGDDVGVYLETRR